MSRCYYLFLLLMINAPAYGMAGNDWWGFLDGMQQRKREEAPEAESPQFYITCLICGKAYAEQPDFDDHVQEHARMDMAFRCMQESWASNVERGAIEDDRQEDIYGAGQHAAPQGLPAVIEPAANVAQEQANAITERELPAEFEVGDDLYCQHCSKYFGNKGSFVRHMQGKHGYPKPVRYCHRCLKSFKRASCFWKHRKIHEEQDRLLSQNTGGGHVQENGVSGLSGEKGEAEACSIQWFDPQGLNELCEPEPEKELRQQEGGGPQEVHATRDDQGSLYCEYCFRPFEGISGLATHVLYMHRGGKRFRCLYCPKAFNIRGELVNHERIHTGEKPFQCPQCDYAASQRCNLKRHMTVHSQDKPHTCVQCGKNFARKWSLTSHMRRHKPY